jgi:hypothetical protein
MVDFAVLSGGRLFVHLSGEAAQEIESPFATGVIRRAQSIAKRHAWKTQGRGARFMMGLGAMPDELEEPRLRGTMVRFTGLSRGRHPAEVLYSLSTGIVSGLFAFSGGEETRLFHGTDQHVSEPACEPGGERVICTLRGRDSQSHIALIAPDGVGIRQLTVGDAVDSAPCWIPGTSRIVFESRAYGYDRAGNVVDVGAATLQELDLTGGEVQPLVVSPGQNASAPRVGEDGTVLFLRSPVPVAVRVSPVRILLDVLLFPFRILFALLQYLNLFSLNYTGKPIINAGPARARQADVRRAARLGNLASAAADALEETEEPKIPDTWQLVARHADGREEVLARGVTCFDLCRDGSVLWSGGRRIVHRAVDGGQTEIARVEQVGELLALERVP